MRNLKNNIHTNLLLQKNALHGIHQYYKRKVQ